MLIQEASVSNGERMRPGKRMMLMQEASVSNGERMRPGNDVDARGFSI